MEIKIRPVPEEWPELTSHPILQRIYASRGVRHQTELERDLKYLCPFTELSNIDTATRRLAKALSLQERILIIGDFDTDGATSTALAVSALRLMGAQFVEFLVPNRFEFGYGLTPAIVEVAKRWKPNLIITVDNGIVSVEGVAAANEAGIDVLITDHHLPGDSLPDAVAIVNPNQKGDHFKSKAIAGVGVIFYVMLALRRHLISIDWFTKEQIPEPNMAQFLDLVALGTIADVVPLDHNNRIMVNQGVLRIRQGLCRPGIQALIQVAGRVAAQLRETDLGFAIAPRLNAAGRLDDMSLGIECLLTNDFDKALLLAKELDNLNQERRKIELEMKDQAMEALNQLAMTLQSKSQLPLGLCLMDPNWHQGVIGILAGRLKDHYHRPTIVFAKVSETELKGSARSIEGLNIRDVLALLDKNYPDLIIKFGGHAMAAGLSIHPSKLLAFKQAFIEEVSLHIDLSHCKEALFSDGALQVADMTQELAKLINQSGPWGQQFPEPVFDNVFTILDQRIVGKNHLKLIVMHEKGGEPLDAIAFNVNLNEWPNHRVGQLRMAYKLDINEYQGRTKLQLIVLTLFKI